ncbi:MAG TPA: MFS transporter [Marinilabiliales bacterium]|nr:MAG: MFS transporter [Bacteroidetes bacterium GWD2_40_43]OFX95305.1 MAG: MFS transporter [Bacteroidetes bacterium GWE2_40_63]OFY21857.1 MAG: MFS transporter [Bacteroidetes bacterium GWF2_40_13]OFZ26132.1 MAG: MFS transporter [Bacteroidetes bacterium RIFOXYC2_FULL_40_12]HAM99861.1 MFS transporter [Marinilabiliales bacterium]
MNRNYYLLALIFIVFFVISFLTNILGPINPNASDSFHLSGLMTGMLPFSFFIAYALMSIPAGMLAQKYGEKSGMSTAFALATGGALLFALNHTFLVFLVSLFLIGTGMALLQVAINPLLRVTGGEGNFAFYSVFAQLVFGGASYLSPFVYSYLVTNLNQPAANQGFFISIFNKVTPDNLNWVSIYWLFAFITLLMAVVILLSRFPKVERKDDELVGAWSIHRKLFGIPIVWYYFFGIFAYVGTEQGIANWISEFLRTYHGLTPEIEGAQTVAWFWGMLTIGCLLGLFLLKIIDSKIVLRVFTIAAMLVLILTLTGTTQMALLGFPALGFCLSVMWSIIFSLALNSVAGYHGTFSGILCTAIAGGAIVSLAIGQMKDWVGLKAGMFILFITLAYILSLSFWAKPLIKNRTIKSKEK